LLDAFRLFAPPIIGRVEQDRFILDLKAVDEDDGSSIARAIKRILRQPGR
jgi:hypothetical protein